MADTGRTGTSPATRFTRIREALERYDPPPGWPAWVYEFLLFGFKQGWACLFGALILALLIATHLFYPDDAALPRYDFLTIAAALIQLALLAFRLEDLREAKVILIFHLVGTVMELFKTGFGSWTYPEAAYLRIAGVPLFSGFMYAAVGSYIARITRIFDMRYSHYPPVWATWLLACGIYVNFFAHHWVWDMRLALFAACGMLFLRTSVWFRPFRRHRRMPLLVGFLLVAGFIWFAENIATFSNAWVYPDQAAGWKPVSPAKLGSWYLLMIISFVLTGLVHRPRPIGDLAGSPAQSRYATSKLPQ